ncbi:hypothetical protein Tco_0438251 [Tanacetum coccineum]
MCARVSLLEFCGAMDTQYPSVSMCVVNPKLPTCQSVRVLMDIMLNPPPSSLNTPRPPSPLLPPPEAAAAYQI